MCLCGPSLAHLRVPRLPDGPVGTHGEGAAKWSANAQCVDSVFANETLAVAAGPYKVCLVGASAVGKTSLVARFVRGVFSERYLTTIGVKIDRATAHGAAGEAALVLWDLSGDDRFQPFELARLRGARGYLLVADGTRAATLDVARALDARIRAEYGPLDAVLVVNKADRRAEWEIDPDGLGHAFRGDGGPPVPVLTTSAATGDGVEAAFAALADAFAARAEASE